MASDKVFPALPILVIDDDVTILYSLKRLMAYVGYTNVVTCNDSRKVMDMLGAGEYSLVLLDLLMPFISGRQLLDKISEKFPATPVVIITGINDVETAVSCMQSNAYDYLLKPIDESRLSSTIKHALQLQAILNQNRMLQDVMLSDELEHPEVFSSIITKNKKMKAIFQYIEAISSSTQPLLITGETGTGKELIARCAHVLNRPKNKLVSINVAGLDDTVFSDTLFGHVKGAFTGAVSNRKGQIELAKNGTLFLDEIGDLSRESQTKLLRIIQEGEYLPVGSDYPSTSNCRIIAATNNNLPELCQSGQFRNDLYYRLHTHHVHIPPLRERLADIAPLLDYFVRESAKELNKKAPTCPPELVPMLRTYDFPGNVRELRSLVFDAVASHKSRMMNLRVFKEYLGEKLGESPQVPEIVTNEGVFAGLEKLPSIKEATSLLVKEALARSGENQTLAAQMLGIARQTLARYIK